jgi:hypothetical protein
MFLFFTGAIHAQENQFVIYSLKGNVTVTNNKTESKAKIGMFLPNDAIIKVSPGSFATLICNETRMFSLSTPASYSLSGLKDSCKESKNSFNANYVKYMWGQFTKAHGSPEKNRTSYMSNVGAVSRGINNVWIDPKLDTVNYVSGTVPLSWKSYMDAAYFDFKLYDETGTTVVFSKTIKKKHIDITELAKTILPGKTYRWTATVKDEPDNDDKKILRYRTKEEYNSFYNSIKNAGPENEAEKYFRIGFLLEENHYLGEAYSHYLKATQLAPDNSLYRFTFMSFKKDYEIK